MENILWGIPHVTVYLEDIILMGATKVQHLEMLDLVLDRLEEVGLWLKRKKRTFLADNIVYLGHRIDQHGLHPVLDKMKAIQKARSPENVQDLHAFLGLLYYYGRSLYNLSTVLAPLHTLLCNGQKCFCESQLSFQRAKELLLSAEVLERFDPTKSILLQCDASNYGLGAVLSHHDGTERPVTFAPRTLNAVKRNYS